MFKAIRVEQLVSELDDPDKRRRFMATHILVKLGKFALNDLLQIMEGERDETAYFIAAVIVQIGNPAVDGLIQTLETATDLNNQRMIIQILGEIGDPRAIKPLQGILSTDNQELNGVVIETLLNIFAKQLHSIKPAN